MNDLTKLLCVTVSLFSLFTLTIKPAVAEKGILEQEIYNAMPDSLTQRNHLSWGVVDAVKLALENDNSIDVITAKGMKEVAAGAYQEKKGAFNVTFGFSVDASQEVMPTPSWVDEAYHDLKDQEKSLPGGSAPALANAYRVQALRAEQGLGSFVAVDLKNLNDLNDMSSGLRQLGAATIEQNTRKTTVSASLKKKFRMGVFAKLETILDRTDPHNYNSEATQGSGALNVGIVQFNVRVPLLRNSGPDAYLWTVEEKEKALDYKSKQQIFRHQVSNRVLEVVKAYWDYKASMEKLDIHQVSESMVKKWASNAKKGGRENEINTLNAHLAGESQDLEEAKSLVFEKKVNLAEVLGISVEALVSKGYPDEEFPSDLAVNMKDDVLKKRLFALAQRERSDLKAAKYVEEKSTTLLTKAKKDLLPSLVLDMTTGVMGGEAGGSTLGHAFNGFNENVVSPNWKVGVVFEYPFGNDAAIGSVRQNNMAYMRDSMLLAEKNRSVHLSVQKSLRMLEHKIPSVALSKQSIKSYWPSVEGSLEKYTHAKSGDTFSTLLDLLDLEERLRVALVKHIIAKSELAKALADVRFNTGTLLPVIGDSSDFQVSKEALVTLP